MNRVKEIHKQINNHNGKFNSTLSLVDRATWML